MSFLVVHQGLGKNRDVVSLFRLQIWGKISVKKISLPIVF